MNGRNFVQHRRADIETIGTRSHGQKNLSRRGHIERLRSPARIIYRDALFMGRGMEREGAIAEGGSGDEGGCDCRGRGIGSAQTLTFYLYMSRPIGLLLGLSSFFRGKLFLRPASENRDIFEGKSLIMPTSINRF